MIIDWSRAIVQKTTDAKGRRVDRVVYSDEKTSCTQCAHYKSEEIHKKTHHYCKLSPDHELRDYSVACVQLEVKTKQ